MATTSEVVQQVREEIEAQGFVAGLAERVGATATAGAVFGQPVERGDVTVIPVARAVWGFGGGSGGTGDQRGEGGGGGGVVIPVGYIEVRGTGARFRPVRKPRGLVLAAAALGFAGLALRRLGRDS
ncbi:MAG TPA: spore germination protein GerW family protein [Solirubrobacterales bacterium]|nr:spore germination protein GerW family protein [Solirubrobacterales bacterium]